MDSALNKEILRLSIPSILANLTVPLVGLVDTAVAGHLEGGAAAFIGAISVGSMLFNLLYWNFGFLRTGTGGLTAQAYGRMSPQDCAAILMRGLALALGIAVLTLALSIPFVNLALLCTEASPEVESLALRYFLVRIWAAPATLCLMVFSGWFVGMQDSVSSMWKDLIVNGVNIAASVMLSLGAGSWKGIGFDGVALGTVVAQYSGLLFCILVCTFKYRHGLLDSFRLSKLHDILKWREVKGFFKMNADLFCRSLFFTCIYMGYTIIAATFGDTLLACSSLMMQMLMIFSYFTDGFAYAAEALTGRFIGAGDSLMMKRSVRYTFIWSMTTGMLFIAVYALAGVPLLKVLTDDDGVVEACRQFLPWLLLMPPTGCAAFFWDGVFLGATASRGVRNAMAGAAAAFFAVWFIGKLFIPEGIVADNLSMHLLLGAYFAHLLFRAIYLSAIYRRQVLNFFF